MSSGPVYAPIYDPSFDAGQPVIVTYWAAFTGERSRMNQLLMQERLKRMNPASYDKEILELRKFVADQSNKIAQLNLKTVEAHGRIASDIAKGVATLLTAKEYSARDTALKAMELGVDLVELSAEERAQMEQYRSGLAAVPEQTTKIDTQLSAPASNTSEKQADVYRGAVEAAIEQADVADNSPEADFIRKAFYDHALKSGHGGAVSHLQRTWTQNPDAYMAEVYPALDKERTAKRQSELITPYLRGGPKRSYAEEVAAMLGSDIFGSAPAAGVPAAPGGYAPAAPGGYAPAAPGGYAPAAPSGYAPAAPSGYAPAAPSGYAPAAPGGYAPAAPGGYAPAVGAASDYAPPPTSGGGLLGMLQAAAAPAVGQAQLNIEEARAEVKRLSDLREAARSGDLTDIAFGGSPNYLLAPANTGRHPQQDVLDRLANLPPEGRDALMSLVRRGVSPARALRLINQGRAEIPTVPTGPRASDIAADQSGTYVFRHTLGQLEQAQAEIDAGDANGLKRLERVLATLYSLPGSLQGIAQHLAGQLIDPYKEAEIRLGATRDVPGPGGFVYRQSMGALHLLVGKNGKRYDPPKPIDAETRRKIEEEIGVHPYLLQGEEPYTSLTLDIEDVAGLAKTNDMLMADVLSQGIEDAMNQPDPAQQVASLHDLARRLDYMPKSLKGALGERFTDGVYRALEQQDGAALRSHVTSFKTRAEDVALQQSGSTEPIAPRYSEEIDQAVREQEAADRAELDELLSRSRGEPLTVEPAAPTGDPGAITVHDLAPERLGRDREVRSSPEVLPGAVSGMPEARHTDVAAPTRLAPGALSALPARQRDLDYRLGLLEQEVRFYNKALAIASPEEIAGLEVKKGRAQVELDDVRHELGSLNRQVAAITAAYPQDWAWAVEADKKRVAGELAAATGREEQIYQLPEREADVLQQLVDAREAFAAEATTENLKRVNDLATKAKRFASAREELMKHDPGRLEARTHEVWTDRPLRFTPEVASEAAEARARQKALEARTPGQVNADLLARATALTDADLAAELAELRAAPPSHANYAKIAELEAERRFLHDEVLPIKVDIGEIPAPVRDPSGSVSDEDLKINASAL